MARNSHERKGGDRRDITYIQTEIVDTSEELLTTHSGRAEAQAHQWGTVGNIRLGFRLSPDGKHVEPDPGEQGVLAEIGHLRQSGHTLRGIAAALNRKALRTHRGSAWRLEHVARMMKQAVSR